MPPAMAAATDERTAIPAIRPIAGDADSNRGFGPVAWVSGREASAEADAMNVFGSHST